MIPLLRQDENSCAHVHAKFYPMTDFVGPNGSLLKQVDGASTPSGGATPRPTRKAHEPDAEQVLRIER